MYFVELSDHDVLTVLKAKCLFVQTSSKFWNEVSLAHEKSYSISFRDATLTIFQFSKLAYSPCQNYILLFRHFREAEAIFAETRITKKSYSAIRVKVINIKANGTL